MGLFGNRQKRRLGNANALASSQLEVLASVSTSGFHLPGYDGLEVIAQGGSSVVFRGRDVALDRPVAIKVLPRLAGDPSSSERFRREKEIAALLGRHPHIVQVLDAGEAADSSSFLVMEYFELGSLADQLRKSGALEIDDAIDTIAKIADALSAAHTNDVLHRDVKPSNILRSEYGPALSDFGISRSVSRGEWTQSLEQFTPWHAAPEILEGQNPTVASDIYSLGSTLATLLAGRPPFARVDDDRPLAYNLRVLSEPVPPIGRTDMPAALQDTLFRAMDKDPSRRHGTAAEFASDLRRVARELQSQGAAVAGISLPEAPSSPESIEGDRGDKERLWGRSLPLSIDSPTSASLGSAAATRDTTFEPPAVASERSRGADLWGRSATTEKKPNDTELQRAKTVGALRSSPAAAPARVDDDGERTEFVGRGELARSPVPDAPAKTRPRFAVAAAAAVLFGAALGAAIIFWPRTKTAQPISTDVAAEVAIAPMIGPSSPRNVTLVEEQAKGVIGLDANGVTQTSLGLSEPTDNLIEVRWDDGDPAVSASYVVVYPTGGTPRNVAVTDPEGRYTAVPGIKANGRYCIWVVAVKDIRTSFRSEQSCIRNGRPFSFPDEAAVTATTTKP
jgi:serine/threonine protein kinase